MTRFIDTNIFVACLRGRADHVREKFLHHSPGEILVPFQVLAELKLGAAKSARPAYHGLQVDNILRPFAIAWPDIAAVEHYVDIRATLEKASSPSPTYGSPRSPGPPAESSSPTTPTNSPEFPV